VKLLLDTHVLLWVLGDPGRLDAETVRTLADANNAVFVSVVALWEIALKRRIGKLDANVTEIAAQLSPASKIQLLGLTPHHLGTLDRLPFHEQHRDPFDHLLIAQAIAEDMIFVTKDHNAPLYQVRVMAP
jgi:PIN domain nuclease of toxin-antitoxin system